MGATTELRLLGPVELRAGGRVLELGPPKQLAVFAALAVDAGRPVPVTTLVDRVWDEAPPAQARSALYAHIMRIRRVLASVGAADGDEWRLERSAGGYRLEVDPDRVDLHRLSRLVGQARALELDDGRRAPLLREALQLWRGTPLDGVGGSWAARVRHSCQQQRYEVQALDDQHRDHVRRLPARSGRRP
jgi:two-component SAPR family response regulator